MDDKTRPTQSKKSVAQQRMAAQAREQRTEIVEKAKGKVGQPTKFTPELWEDILDRLACCENIVDICAEPGMPSYYTVRKWWRANPELKAQVEEAWKDAAYLMHYVNDSILSGGTMSVKDFRRDDARAANNRWFMGKVHRGLFGDKTLVQVETVEPFVLEGWMLPGEIIDPKPDEDA